MAMIANLQYGWTLFVNPIVDTYHFDKKALQYAFTIFVLSETWLVPFKGYAVDKIGPRFLVVTGGLLVGASWVMNAYASSLESVLPGRFHRRSGSGRGLRNLCRQCSQMVSGPARSCHRSHGMGFGVGSALTVTPIYNMIQSPDFGYRAAFLYFGIGQGAIVFILGWFFRSPDLKAH